MRLSDALGALAAALASGLTIPLVLRRARQDHLLDRPNPRSSHVVPTPRGGGVGVIVGLAAGLLLLVATDHRLDLPALWLLAATFVLAGVGLWDDLQALPVLPRLALQVVVATLVAIGVGSIETLPLPTPLDRPIGALGVPLTVLWIVGVMNFFNFMDGIDGLAGGQAAASCAGIFFAGWSRDAMSLACLLLGAVAGFLVFNWPPARVFLGDVGSLSVGFLLAALPLLAPAPERAPAVLTVTVGLALFLLDPLFTLIRRALGGRPLGRAHREHAYQRFLAPGQSHRLVTTALVLTGLALSLLGALAYRFRSAGWPVLALACLAFLVEERAAASAEAKRRAPAPADALSRPD